MKAIFFVLALSFSAHARVVSLEVEHREPVLNGKPGGEDRKAADFCGICSMKGSTKMIRAGACSTASSTRSEARAEGSRVNWWRTDFSHRRTYGKPLGADPIRLGSEPVLDKNQRPFSAKCTVAGEDFAPSRTPHYDDGHVVGKRLTGAPGIQPLHHFLNYDGRRRRQIRF